MIVTGEATSRAEIARFSGLARSTVGHQVDELLARGIVEESTTDTSVRGRPARKLLISPRAGAVAVADIDVGATQVAIADLKGDILARDVVDLPVEVGPDRVLGAVGERLGTMLTERGQDPTRVRHVVIGLPAPVDFQRGSPVRPPIMPGWDGFPVGDHLRAQFHTNVTVDNDVNLMA